MLFPIRCLFGWIVVDSCSAKNEPEILISHTSHLTLLGSNSDYTASHITLLNVPERLLILPLQPASNKPLIYKT